MRSQTTSSETISSVLCFAGGLVAGVVLSGGGMCTVSLSWGRFGLGILFAVVVPFFAALSEQSPRSSFQRWVIPALVFSLPLTFPVLVGMADNDWLKGAAAVAGSMTAFAMAYLSDRISRHGSP
jgi:hypothetical protein